MPAPHDNGRRAGVDARLSAARRFGLRLGCIAAVLAGAIQLIWRRHELTPRTCLVVGLMALLNVPLGVLFALVGERVSRGAGDGE